MIKRRIVFACSIVALVVITTTKTAMSMDATVKMDSTSQASFDTVMSFMSAMGTGDMDGMSELMADDMEWRNEGDARMPWIGPWKGKEAIFGFLKIFTENVQTKFWENDDAFASGDTVAVYGRMRLLTTKSGAETPEFTFALRAKVHDGKLVLWNWFEDSYAVSQAFHGL